MNSSHNHNDFIIYILYLCFIYCILQMYILHTYTCSMEMQRDCTKAVDHLRREYARCLPGGQSAAEPGRVYYTF